MALTVPYIFVDKPSSWPYASKRRLRRFHLNTKRKIHLHALRNQKWSHRIMSAPVSSYSQKKHDNNLEQNDAPRQQFPLAVACFDFDLTLSSHRVYGRRDFDQIPMLFGGEKRIALLQKFFSFLVFNHNVRIIVVSWNYKEIILEALQQVGLASYVYTVFDRPHLIRHGGYKDGKRNIVQAVICQEWNIDPNRVVFVDDSQEALQDMLCPTVWVKEKTGLELSEMKTVARILVVDDFEPSDNDGT